MKLFFVMLLGIFFTIGVSAQGVTKNGQSTTTSTSFVGINGQVANYALVNKNGQIQPLTIGMSLFGGKLFYILQPGDPGYIAGVTQGLIAAVSDQSAGAPFGTDYVTSNGWGTAIGTGNSNTTTIVVSNGTAGIAARLCNDLVTGGYSDWYLPSYAELNKLYLNRVAVGGFSAANYWSSSEYDNGYYDGNDEDGWYWNAWYEAFAQSFGTGAQTFYMASTLSRVRAIRSFGPASVTTAAISGYGNLTATSGGNVTSDGGAPITARGVCWSTSANPTVANSKTNDGSGAGSYASTMTGLTPGTFYYVRSYATNISGTVYGNQVTFTLGIINLTTTAPTQVTVSSATGGGNITSDGGVPITARGVCWSLSTGPTLANNFTIDGTGTGLYSSSITSLTSPAVYFVRAYATNSLGTTYGNEVLYTPGIGMSYQGGILAYILKPGDPGYVAGVPHGIIATVTDQSAGAAFGTAGVWTGGSGSALGSGNANTNTIVANNGTAGIAARICYDLNTGGYTDWYLPSYYELNKLYLNRVAIGGFAAANYWTSSEGDLGYWYFDEGGCSCDVYQSDYEVAYQSFSTGIQNYTLANNLYRVRAIRSF